MTIEPQTMGFGKRIQNVDIYSNLFGLENDWKVNEKRLSYKISSTSWSLVGNKPNTGQRSEGTILVHSVQLYDFYLV